MEKGFQPTRPLRGATPLAFTACHSRALFQPTRPLRGATCLTRLGSTGKLHFNPRAPCGARQKDLFFLDFPVAFQPTRPLRGATALCRRAPHTFRISTHAPLAGRDFFSVGKRCRRDEISTHAPLAGRDEFVAGIAKSTTISTHAPLAGRDVVVIYLTGAQCQFQPTRPLRGATAKVYKSLCTFLR